MAEQANPSTAMATAVMDELARGGVTHVIVAPGSRSTALAIAASRHLALTVYVRHDERSAAFVALGIGRASGRPAAVVTTSGTAVANLAPAVAEADAAGIPLVVVTADRPAELHDVGANQTMRQARLLDSLVRLAIDLPAATGHVTEPASWRSTVARLVAVAMGVGGGSVAQVGTGGGAGPVHLNLAFREPTVPGLDDGRTTVAAHPHDVAGRADGAPWTTFVAPASDAIAMAARVVAQVGSRRALVIAGDCVEPVHGLEDLPWPVVAEPTAGPRHGVGLAHGSLVLGAMLRDPTALPEVVVRLGHPTLSRDAVVGPLADVPTIVVAPSGIVDPTRRAVLAITASPADVVAAIPSVVDDHRGNGSGDAAATWSQRWVEAAGTARRVVAEHLDVASAPEPAVARRVVAAAGARPLVVASSLPIRDVADHADASAGRVLANRGLAGIDGFVSTAVGVATAAGPTIALAGDLSFLHDHNGLLVDDPAAVDLHLVVVDNDGGGLFHHVPASRVPEFEALFATPHGRDLVAIARAAGARARVVGVDEVGAVLAAPGSGLQVTVVHTDRHAGAAARAALRRDLADRLG